MRIILISILVVLSWINPAEGPIHFDKSIQKKFNTAVQYTYHTTNFSLINVLDSSVLPLSGEVACVGQTYRVMSADSLLGFVHFDSGMGRYESFEFVVLYDVNQIIRQVEILVYRSDHGFEIMNKRWLAQFSGKTGCCLVYGKDIDAISGATLSGTSLTETIAEICVTMQPNTTFVKP